MLSSIIASMYPRVSKPLNEQKVNSRSSKLIKLSFNSDNRHPFKPKLTNNSLKTYLKKNKCMNSELQVKNLPTTPAQTDTRNCKFDTHKKVCKSYRKTNKSINQKKPSKNLSINIAARNEVTKGLKPIDLGNNEPLQPGSAILFPNYETAKYSLRSINPIQAYAVNTNQGIVR